MVIKESPGRKVFNLFNILLMVGLMIVTVYPILYIIFASVSDSTLLLAHRGLLLKPQGINFATYSMVFDNPMILRGYLNTLFIVITGTAVNLLMTSLGAYVLSRKNLMFQNLFLFLVMFTMFFGGGLIPTYLNIKSLGMLDTYWALILPGAVATMNLIIMRTSFLSIPESLEESATIDGASHWTILFRIVLPLSLPVVAVMILYYGVGHWNAWFNASIYLKEREKFPLQVILREILLQNDTESMTQGVSAMDHRNVSETVKYAVIVVATLPVLCIYPFLQKYFVKGVMIGAVKG